MGRGFYFDGPYEKRTNMIRDEDKISDVLTTLDGGGVTYGMLEEAKAKGVEKYPERFGVAPAPRDPAPARPARRAAAVAAPTAGERAPAPGTRPTTINSIQDPAERAQAREAFNRMKRQMSDYTEAEYMALYDDPHGDVLTMQQKPRSQPNGR